MHQTDEGCTTAKHQSAQSHLHHLNNIMETGDKIVICFYPKRKIVTLVMLIKGRTKKI